MKNKYGKILSLFLVLLIILSTVLSAIGCDGDEEDKTPTDAPVLMWKADGLFALIPPPTTAYGKILTDTKEFIEFETYYVEKTDFSLYIQLCTEKGYTYSVVNSEFFYSATNAAGYKLSVQFNESQKTIKASLDASNIKLTVSMSSDYFKGLQQDDVIEMLRAIGFSNISVKITEIPDDSEILNGTVESVRINSLPFEEDAEFQKTDPVVVRYYMRSITVNNSSTDFVGKNYAEVEALLLGAGFINVTCKESIVPADSALSESLHGSVFAISINGKGEFAVGERFSPNSIITVTYYSFNISMDLNADSMRFSDPETLASSLRAKGFKNVSLQVTRDISGIDIDRYDGTVASVSIGGNTSFAAGQVFERTATVVITYYQYYITIGRSAQSMKGYMSYQEAEAYLKERGFTNVTSYKSQPLITGWMHYDGEVYGISINTPTNFTNFTGDEKYPYDIPISIAYYYKQ